MYVYIEIQWYRSPESEDDDSMILMNADVYNDNFKGNIDFNLNFIKILWTGCSIITNVHYLIDINFSVKLNLTII